MSLRFLLTRRGRTEEVEVQLHTLVCGGMTGRDEAEVRKHLDEMAALGVAPPSTIPIYYRLSASLLTTTGSIQVLGEASSGEIEAALVALEGGLWVGVGSDHTDREVEAYGVAVSKQVCPKPIAPELWPFDEVAAHWDRLVLRSHVTVNGRRRLYQEGTLALTRPPQNLIRSYPGAEGALPAGTVLFCGTQPVRGAMEGGERFEMEIEDPVLKRRIAHAYAIERLPIVT
ncbi:MAG: DUF2848 domain-containing protein [Proteobacteria bacterium]|nr:DUF2848 domain-containing protein [Pseudomonadota bacterium]